MFQMTLKAVRESCGHSVEDAANFCDLTRSEYIKIEEDAGLLNVKIMQKLRKLYNGVPLEIIYPGKIEDCIKHNQKVLS